MSNPLNLEEKTVHRVRSHVPEARVDFYPQSQYSRRESEGALSLHTTAPNYSGAESWRRKYLRIPRIPTRFFDRFDSSLIAERPITESQLDQMDENGGDI